MSNVEPSVYRYANELEADAPAALAGLRRLAVPSLQTRASSPGGRATQALLGDLLRAAAGSLRHVVMGEASDLSAGAVAGLARCEGLLSLEAGATCLPALGRLGRLQSLTVALRMSTDQDQLLAEAPPRGALPELRRLHVSVSMREVRGGAVLLALARASPNVTALTISSPSPGTGLGQFKGLEEALACLPRLRVVSMLTCGVEHVAMLTGLPELVWLKVDVRCPVSQRDRCIGLIAEFKRRRPDADVSSCSVHVVLDGPTNFKW